MLLGHVKCGQGQKKLDGFWSWLQEVQMDGIHFFK
jgi:hypothetical protein